MNPLTSLEDVSPEETLAYIYAALYSPTYRERYYDFLKYDFPRIPLPQDIEQFRTLAALGQQSDRLAPPERCVGSAAASV